LEVFVIPFAEVFESTRSTVKGMTLPVRGKKDPKWDAFAPIDAVWDRLLSGTWPLLPASEINAFAPQLQAVYAETFDITVWKLEYVTGNDLLLGAKPLPWMSADLGQRIALEISYAVAENLGTSGLAKRLSPGDSERVGTSDACVPQLSAFDQNDFQVALWHTMVQSHGAAGHAAAIMLRGALREYTRQMAAGNWVRASQVRSMLETLQYGIPLARAGKHDKTLVLLSGLTTKST
jgi:hypothetical protein